MQEKALLYGKGPLEEAAVAQNKNALNLRSPSKPSVGSKSANSFQSVVGWAPQASWCFKGHSTMPKHTWKPMLIVLVSLCTDGG